MTIVYFITTVGHGKGGHFHSLNTIANAMGETENVHVINFGVQASEVLDNKNYKLTFINFNGYNFLPAYFSIKKHIKTLQPDAIHAFDVESFAFSRLFSRGRGQASFLNKCGGPNPKKYFPIAHNLVLFSKENKAYFENKERYNASVLTLIPNRVRPIQLSQTRIDEFYAKHGKAELSLLRIARIGKHYHTSISQSINLVSWLIAKGLNVRLIVIGTIQSKTNYEAIIDEIKSKKLEDNVIVETSDKFTYNASELLDVGDVIIGTGRNFMEASSLNKMLLVPYKDADYPLLVTNGNFEAIFATNFSPRTQVPDFNEEANLEDIYNALKNEDKMVSISWFESYFNVKNGVDMYKNIYLNQDLSKKSNLIDTFANILYLIKTFVLR